MLICKGGGAGAANTLIENPDGEEKAGLSFSSSAAAIAVDPVLLKFGDIMEIIELVKGCLRRKKL